MVTASRIGRVSLVSPTDTLEQLMLQRDGADLDQQRNMRGLLPVSR
jgi:hypothetical protein